MADGIFTEDELKADALTGNEEAPEIKPEDQGADGQPRDDAGKFAKKPDPADEGGDQGGDGEQGGEEGHKSGTVPQGALHAEREKRKASEERERAKDAELQAAREQLAAIAKMREQIAARKPEPMPEADDPAALEHLRQRLAQTEATVTRYGQQIDTQAADNAEALQLQSIMAHSEQAYRAERPDYDEAIKHVVVARGQELQLFGLSPADVQNTIAAEAADIVRSAIAQGLNPAELGYRIAVSRGYRPAGEQQPEGKAVDKLAAIAKAQGGPKSLGQLSGSAPKQMNAEAVAALSSEDFEALYSTPEGKALIDGL
jgi:hypothetical protein